MPPREVNVYTKNKSDVPTKKLRIEVQHEADRVKKPFRTITMPDDLALLPDAERMELYEALAIRVARYLDAVDNIEAAK